MKKKTLGNPVTGGCFLSKPDALPKSKSLSLDNQKKPDNSVYNYQVKSGKKMSEPIRDDNIIGGYFNLGVMTSAEADKYTKAKQKANAEKAIKDKEKRAKAYNPFAGFDDIINDEPSNDDFSL